MIRKRINAVQICRHPRQDSNLRWLGNSKYVMTTKMLLSPLLTPQNNPLQMLGTFEKDYEWVIVVESLNHLFRLKVIEILPKSFAQMTCQIN